MPFKFNPLTGNLDLVNAAGPGGTITGVLPTDSIDFSVIGGNTITGDVKTSSAAADSGNTKVDLDIQPDGLRAQIPNADIQSVSLNLQGPISLPDNSLTTILSYPIASNNFTFIEYSIVRNSQYRSGRLLLANTASSVSIADSGYVETGIVGASFSAAVVGTDIEVKCQTTNAGFAATLKFTVKQWS